MTRSPFLWTFSPTQHVRKTGFSSLLFPAADGPRGAPRGPSPHTSHALYRYPCAFSQFRDCPVTIDSHQGTRWRAAGAGGRAIYIEFQNLKDPHEAIERPL